MRRALAVVMLLVIGFAAGSVATRYFTPALPVGRYLIINGGDDRHSLIRFDTSTGRVEKYVTDGVIMGEWQEVLNWGLNPQTNKFEFSANSLPLPTPTQTRSVPNPHR